MLADQWNKSTTSMIFFSPALFRFYYSNQSLVFTRFADRYNQSPADFELRKQRFWNRWTTRSHENSIVRCVCGPTKCAVETFYRGIVDTEFPNSRLRFTRKIPDALDRINLCGNPG